MPSEIYEIISLGARYWFAFLGVLIVWRSFRWLRKDRKAKHRRLKQLPDAGMIGELVVLTGSEELPAGTTLPLPREGTLGFLRTCDLTLPVSGVAARHLDFIFQDGRGLLIYPRLHCTALVDGNEVAHFSRPKDHPMHHGSRLTVGNAVLRMRLFVGLETERQAMLAPDQEPPLAQPDAQVAVAQDWQNTAYIYHQIPAAWVDQTGQYQPFTVVGTAIDPATGLPYPQQPIDPATGLPYTPFPIDPATGLPYTPPGAPLDPVTGQPISTLWPPAWQQGMPYDPAAMGYAPVRPTQQTPSAPPEDVNFDRSHARDKRRLFARRHRHE